MPEAEGTEAVAKHSRERTPEIRLEVTPVDDASEILLDDLSLLHTGCGPMRTRRNPATDDRTTTCVACGLEFELTGDREQRILRVALSGSTESFAVNGATIVVTVARERRSK